MQALPLESLNWQHHGKAILGGLPLKTFCRLNKTLPFLTLAAETNTGLMPLVTVSQPLRPMALEATLLIGPE
jgi:hypothetical protein